MANLKTVRETVLAMGLVPGTKEYLRAYKLERWNRLPLEKKKEKWAKSYQQRKLKFKNDPSFAEQLREKDRLQKRKQREKRKDEINAKQRENYRKGGEARRKLINEGKKRRDPTRGLTSLRHAVRRGDADPRELVDRTRAAISQCGALIHRGEGNGLSGKQNGHDHNESE